MTQSAPIDSSLTQTRGISGRVFVFGFLPLIAVVGFAMFSVAMRFQTIMKHLEHVRAAWPSVAKDLKHRYEKFEQRVNESAPDNFPRQEWNQLKQEFEASNQFDRQSKVVPKMESIISNSTGQPDWESSDFENQRFVNLSEAEQVRQRVQNDWLGKLTVVSLRLRLPPQLEVPRKTATP